MSKKDKVQKNGKPKEKKKEYLLTLKTKRWIKAILMFLITMIVGLSFLNKAGITGQWFVKIIELLVGDSRITITTIILSLLFSAFIFLKSQKKVRFLTITLAIVILITGLSGLLVTNIIFTAVIIIGLLIFLQLIWQEANKDGQKSNIFAPVKTPINPPFKIKGAEEEKPDLQKSNPKISLFKKQNSPVGEQKPASAGVATVMNKGKYSLPPIDLLSKNETVPTSGNIKENSVIIKKTLENFGIATEMAEVNIGPTVTQYAFKPAEGVKLSKITTLSSNLALALAAHPIRI